MTTTVILLATFIAPGCLSHLADAKCARLLLRVSGELKGNVQPGDAVVAEVLPDPNERSPLFEMEGERFAGEIWFDPTRSGGKTHHDCGRTPGTVELRWMRNGKILASATLPWTAFKPNSDGYSYDSAPVQIQADHK